MQLNQNDAQLRALLNPTTPNILDQRQLLTQSSSLVDHILQTDSLTAYEQTKTQLTTLYDGLKYIFDVAEIPVELRQKQFLNKTGLAMSPQHALTTIKDVFRVSAFIRAIDQAIGDLKNIFHEPLHIIYPACGPLAPLMMPLLAYYQSTGKYSPEDLNVTLIDVQEGAVLSLKKLFEASGLAPYIREIVYGDAVDYIKKPNDKIHMVVLEAMQHGFSTEGQMAIALHFSTLIEDQGLFLPEKISIEAVLSSGQEEFVEQWSEQDHTHAQAMKPESKEARIKLGTVLEVTTQKMSQLEIMQIDEYTRLIRCASLAIPHFEIGEKQHMLLFCTKITIYNDEMLDEYDSGITHPLPDMNVCINFVPKNDQNEEDLLVNSGDTLVFFYRMNGLPGFLVTKAQV
ncbi:MAG: hypothetical protein Q9M28_04275 [Mariprofundaceae bacterium]|nr:hypothetical protein [Mariprofundaceae bacterium]